MSPPTTKWARIGDHEGAPLIVVEFGGVYPPVSGGNEFARAMVTHLRTVLARTRAAGVVIDLSALEYAAGDAIGELALALLDDDKSRFRASAIVATGNTAAALEPLLGSGSLMGIAGMKLVGTRQEGLALLEQALETRATAGSASAARAHASGQPGRIASSERKHLEGGASNRQRHAGGAADGRRHDFRYVEPAARIVRRTPEAPWVLALLISGAAGGLAAVGLLLVWAPGREWRLLAALGLVCGLINAAAAGKFVEAIMRVLTFSIVLAMALFVIPQTDARAAGLRALILSLYASASVSQLLMGAFNEFLEAPE